MQLGTDEVDDSQGPPHMFDALTKVLVRRTDDNATHVATARKDVGGRRDAILPVELAMMGARDFPVEEPPPRVPCSPRLLYERPRYLCRLRLFDFSRFPGTEKRRDLVSVADWTRLTGEGQIFIYLCAGHSSLPSTPTMSAAAARGVEQISIDGNK